MIAFCTSFGTDQPAFVDGLRTLGNKTPIIDGWASDGAYWWSKNPKITNFYFLTYASALTPDPSAAVNAFEAKMKAIGQPAQTGGFITGADAIDAIAYIIKQAGGSTDGAKLAGRALAPDEVPDARRADQLRHADGAAQRGRAALPGDRGQQQQGDLPRVAHGAEDPEHPLMHTTGGRTLTRPHARRPEGPTRFGPSASRARSRASRRSRTSTSSSRPARSLGLIGPNGAGKTTLVNLLTGFDLPTRGQITLGGTDITRWPPYRRGRAGLARTFQHGRLFGQLSVRENVEVAALGAGRSAREARRRAGELLELLGLARARAGPRGPAPPRRPAQARRRARARARAALRADGRARRRTARGGDPGVRRRDPRGARATSAPASC